MLTAKEDILNAIINNIQNWDFDVRSSLAFEQSECELILDLVKKEQLEMRRMKNADKQQTEG